MNLQQLLDSARERFGIAGAQLAIHHDGAIHEVASGVANGLTGAAVTADTLFQIGSTTKVYNAALLMTLVDEGLVDLDEPVATYVPWLRLADDVQDRVTLRQLLSMSSGLDNGPYVDLGLGDDAVEAYARLLQKVPLIFEPGTAFGYTNAGTNLAGLVAEAVTGKPWHALLRERVLDPAGLEQSSTELAELLVRRVAIGHEPGGDGAPVPMRIWGLGSAQAPAGGTLCASAGDLVRFAQVFLSDGQAGRGGQVLSPEAVKTMQTPQVECATKLMATHWGAGPYIKTWGGVRVHGHSGTNLGGSSMLLWAPERDIAIATTVNVAPQGYPLADAIFDEVFPKLFGIDKPALPRGGDRTIAFDPGRYAGTYTSLGATIEVTGGQGCLRVASTTEGPSRAGGMEQVTIESDLEPLGGDRFWPASPELSGNRGWDVAFFGETGDGRAANLINGMFALRRAE